MLFLLTNILLIGTEH